MSLICGFKNSFESSSQIFTFVSPNKNITLSVSYNSNNRNAVILFLLSIAYASSFSCYLISSFASLIFTMCMVIFYYVEGILYFCTDFLIVHKGSIITITPSTNTGS
jgi:hypothetical protein